MLIDLTKLLLMAEIHDGKCRGGINLEITLKPNGLGGFFSPVNGAQKWEFNMSEIESASRQDITLWYIWGGTDFFFFPSNSPSLERSLKADILSAILVFVWVKDLRTWILQLERNRCYIESVFTDHTLTGDGDVCVKLSSPSRVRAPPCNKTTDWRASAGVWIFYTLCICWMSRRRRELLGLNYLFQSSQSRLTGYGWFPQQRSQRNSTVFLPVCVVSVTTWPQRFKKKIWIKKKKINEVEKERKR